MSATSGANPPPVSPGKVYIVGAGPGDPGLVTLRAVECLGRASLVLYDYLVNPAVLEHAPASAERVCLGHHHAGRELSPEGICRRMIEAARAGRCVVRLKGGDPDIFGRTAEETAALREAGVAYEIVPGVTAGLAAAAYAEIPLTEAERASAVALVTGHERSDKARPGLDYAALARFPGTLVFYMGVRNAAEWSRALLAGGRSPGTPAALVYRCSGPHQRIVRTTLGSLAETIEREAVRPPAVILVGEVAGLAPATSWFAARPLAGRTVLVTRPRGEGGELGRRLAELGAKVLVQPAIEISAPPDWSRVDGALASLERYDWLVFSSANGVRWLLGRLFATGGDARWLRRVKLAAIGPGTAEELGRFRLHADLVPEEYRAESLADALAGMAAGRRFLLARASRGREVLAERLQAAGAEVDQVVVYSSTDVERPEPAVAAALAEGRIDWITVTSSAIARSLVHLFGEDLSRSRLASISPVTSETLRTLGFEPAAEAAEYTMPGLVAAILSTARG